MIHLSPTLRMVAASLALVAGFVDALGFIHLGGYFVSFMSGNSTRMGVGIADSAADALIPISLVALFVAGVIAGTLISRSSQRRNLLAFVAGLIGLAALCATLGLDWLAVWVTPIAMGAMNTVFQRDGEVSVGVTYMTGTLVKFGQRLASALTGGPRWTWVPFLGLWLGLVLGAVLGAASYRWFGLTALWFPAAAVLAAHLALHRLAPDAI